MFKKDVYQTNHIDVEKHLLLHEGLRQSVRLLLMDAFREEEPTITWWSRNFTAIARHCFKS